MRRALGTVALLLVLCLSAPTWARLAEQAVPALVSLLVFLALVRLIWPGRRRR